MINRVREPFNTGRLAQVAAKAALKDQEFVAKCRRLNAEGITYVREFERLGLSYFPANGNFIMVDVKRPGTEVFKSLLSKGIIVRPGFEVYLNYIRVTVGSEEQNKAFIGALEQVLQEVNAPA